MERTDSGTVRLVVDRDSVAMGDDVESHLQLWELPANLTVAELLSLFASRLLPGVGGFAGWRIYQDVGQDGPGWTLGLVYTRDHQTEERYVCLPVGIRAPSPIWPTAHRHWLYTPRISPAGRRGHTRSASSPGP